MHELKHLEAPILLVLASWLALAIGAAYLWLADRYSRPQRLASTSRPQRLASRASQPQRLASTSRPQRLASTSRPQRLASSTR